MSKQSNYVALLALGLCSTAACASREPEPAMTPAAYTPPPPYAPPAPNQVPTPSVGPSQPTPPPPPSPLSQATTMSDSQRSARAIAAARCEREVRCENIGQEKEYVTEEDCMTALEPDTRKSLGAGECPGGYPAIQLNECVEEVRAESCDTPLDDIARVAECRTTALCPR